MDYTPANSSADNPVYEPLGSGSDFIRLLHLVHANDHDDDICCTLSCVRANGQVPYEALSYCWGSNPEKVLIRLNGLLFSAPASTVVALKYLRYSDVTRVLWIDSLCINQHDTSEREQQVGLMAQIYQSGLQTLIWLGEADDETDGAINVFRLFESTIRAAIMPTEKFMSAFLETMDDIELPECDMSPLNSVFRRPYFSRVWVYQEIVLSSIRWCMIGRLRVQWVWLECILRLLLHRYNQETKEQVLGSGFFEYQSRLLPFWTNMESLASPRRRNLSNLLQRTRDLAATDPRDKIYGLLGLLKIWKPETFEAMCLKVSYSAPVAHCIGDAVRAMIKEDQNLRSLVDYQRWPIVPQTGTSSIWPSWAPRFDKVRGDLDSYPNAEALDDSSSADNGQPVVLREHHASQESEALTVGGIRIGSVVVTFPDPDHDDPVYLCCFVCALTRKFFPDLPHDYLRNISAGGLGKSTIPDTDEFTSFQRSLKVSMEDMLDNEIMWSQQQLSEDVKMFWYHISRACRNRRLFTTSNGYLGLGPARMRSDDIICILFGAPWPVVLRPTQTWYKFIQPCYIDNIMDGKVVREWQATGKELEMFELH